VNVMQFTSRMHERVTSGLSSAEGLISEVLDDTDPPRDRRLLIVQSEFASVLRIMGRDGNTLSPLLRAAWDSGNLRTLVKHDALKATGAHIGVIGHISRRCWPASRTRSSCWPPIASMSRSIAGMGAWSVVAAQCWPT
jgi:hypothetical protein